MGIVILIWYLWSLYFSINMIVRVKNHKGVKNPKLVLCLNILNVDQYSNRGCKHCTI